MVDGDDLVVRSAADQLRDMVADFRAVVINGPRQAGKTTLLEMYRHGQGGTYRSLDDEEQLTAALADPSSYVQADTKPLIIDEVQRGGDSLVLAIKRAVDTNRDTGQFILTGSSRFLTVPTLSESLAGRTVFIDLWPFSMAERTGTDGSFAHRAFADVREFHGAQSTWTRNDYLDVICAGSFPEVLRVSSLASRRRWFNGYVRTVVSRDISEFADVQNLQMLPRLLAMVAARTGGTFVASDIGRGLGTTHDTVQSYLSYLDTVFLVSAVPAWSTNLTSRVTKTPKVYLTDAGLGAHLVRATPAALREPGHPLLGGLTETLVFTELLKLRSLTGDAFEIYHYRDRDGREIDFICETPDGLVLAVEVKATTSPGPRDIRHISWLRDKLGDRFVSGVVLHMGSNSFSYGDRLLSTPISTLWGDGELSTRHIY